MTGSSRLAIIGVVTVVAVSVVLTLTNTDRSGSAAHVATVGDTYDPVNAGEDTPPGFRQLLSRDAIRPVYEPQFTSAADADWHDTTLVIGLEINGDARAYPVSHLNRREIVNDHVGRTPVLVTW